VLGKEVSIYAAANLLDVLLNALPDPVIPVQLFLSVSMATVQASGVLCVVCCVCFHHHCLTQSFCTQNVIESSVCAESLCVFRQPTDCCFRNLVRLSINYAPNSAQTKWIKVILCVCGVLCC
jgi:hypothetical protein